MGYGKRVWIFPDAELPPEGVNIIPGHESIIIANTGDEDAHIHVTFFFTDKEPINDIDGHLDLPSNFDSLFTKKLQNQELG